VELYLHSACVFMVRRLVNHRANFALGFRFAMNVEVTCRLQHRAILSTLLCTHVLSRNSYNRVSIDGAVYHNYNASDSQSGRYQVRVAVRHICSFIPSRNSRHCLQIILRSTVLLEKLIVSQLVKKFTAFYGNRRFIIVFTKALSIPRSCVTFRNKLFLFTVRSC